MFHGTTQYNNNNIVNNQFSKSICNANKTHHTRQLFNNAECVMENVVTIIIEFQIHIHKLQLHLYCSVK